MTELNLTREQCQSILDHCLSVYPEEACGILAGHSDLVEKIYPMSNLEHSSVSYLMDPKEQFQVMKEMRLSGTRMIAIYHSHPHSQAYPSPKDIHLAFYSDSVYVIVSLADKDNPDIRAFEISEGEVRRLDIRVSS